MWLARKRPVEQTIWVPGEPTLIRDRLVNEGGWITRAALPASICTCLHRPARQAIRPKPASGAIILRAALVARLHSKPTKADWEAWSRDLAVQVARMRHEC